MRARLTGFLVLALLCAASLSPTRARASEFWCWDDPVLVIDNQVVHILVGVPEAARAQVRLAVVEVTVPVGVDARLTAAPSPRFPQAAVLHRAGAVGADGSIPVQAVVTVSGQGQFPVALKLSQPGGGERVAYGHAHRPVAETLTLPAKNPPANATGHGNGNGGVPPGAATGFPRR